MYPASCIKHQASCILHPASSSRRGAHEVACRRAEGHGGVVRELACLIWSMTAVVGGYADRKGCVRAMRQIKQAV